jgi:ubiquinone/menaquinone biosynthesis C-methylase UbiE
MKWQETIDDYFEKLGFVKGQYFSDQQRDYYADSLIRGKYSIAIFSFMTDVEDFKKLKIIEPGCGVGSFSLLASKQGAFVVGCDIRKDILKLGKILNKLEGGKAHFVVANCLKMPFKENFFDYVFLWDVLEHTNEQKNMLEDVFRVLAYEGEILAKISNRLFPIEPHTLLPFLTYLPKKYSDNFIKIFRKEFYFWYKSYEKEIYLPTYWSARKWFEESDGENARFYNLFLHYIPFVGTFNMRHNIVTFKLPKFLRDIFGSHRFLNLASKWPIILFVKDWLVVAKKL